MMVSYQVNGCAPQIWSIIRSIFFSALRTKGFGINIVNYFTTEISQLVELSYAENCDMIHSDDDIESTHLKMKLVISELEDLIRIMGGCLAPDKSVWCLVD